MAGTSRPTPCRRLPAEESCGVCGGCEEVAMGIGYRARARAPISHLLFVITSAATIDWSFTPSEDVP
ncbi:hypothetical protein ACQJBY_022513 [Aegilops geniculata]